jgi:uncharacterized membrane protein
MRSATGRILQLLATEICGQPQAAFFSSSSLLVCGQPLAAF